ncbi:MAG: hypothetical protein KM310_09855 [Clostridiales bacterium]|nr:hypothetical protein [Clostridiales bacterium]
MILFLLVGGLSFFPWPSLGGWVLEQQALAQGTPALRQDGVLVLYPEGHEEEAVWVLEGVLRYREPVFSLLGVPVPETIRVVLAADERELEKDLGTREAPLGAFWKDTIWVLAPSAWPRGPVDRETFLEEGPLVHELAHLALHSRAGEAVPVWLDEGIAQWVDEKVTGFLWLDALPRLEAGEGYTYRQLSRWEVGDLALAYLQSYLLVDAIARTHGGEGLELLLQRLERGYSLEASLKAILGQDYPAFVSGAPWTRPIPLP